MNPNWPFNREWKPDDLPVMRREAIRRSAEAGHTITEFTCDNCASRLTCDLVFDGYNTDGDCIADK